MFTCSDKNKGFAEVRVNEATYLALKKWKEDFDNVEKPDKSVMTGFATKAKFFSWNKFDVDWVNLEKYMRNFSKFYDYDLYAYDEVRVRIKLNVHTERMLEVIMLAEIGDKVFLTQAQCRALTHFRFRNSGLNLIYGGKYD